jgi:hypothetical protein
VKISLFTLKTNVIFTAHLGLRLKLNRQFDPLLPTSVSTVNSGCDAVSNLGNRDSSVLHWSVPFQRKR